MDKETKNLLIVGGISLAILWLFRPKNSIINSIGTASDRVSSPMEVSKDRADDLQNAGISLQAMKSAINSGETKSELDKLNKIMFKENGIKVYTLDNGKLAASNRKGKTILIES